MMSTFNTDRYHVTVTDENGKAVIDDDTPLLALAWLTGDDGKHSTCGGGVLGAGNGNQHAALVESMINLASEVVARFPAVALQLALREALGDKGTKIDMSALLRARKDSERAPTADAAGPTHDHVPDSGTGKGGGT